MSAPNILLFLTDDHAQWALGCYGNSEIRTPALDYLAKSGVRFANAFTPTPVCSPARACLHTGRLASQHGVHDYLASADPDINARNWLAGHPTLAQILQSHGYQTGQIGKWHIGQDEFPQPGYDDWFTLGRGYPIIHQGPHEYGFEGEHTEIPGRITHTVEQRAVQFLEKQSQDKPFFMSVGFYATHSPWKGQAEWLAESYRACSFKDVPYQESYPFGVQNLESTDTTRNDPTEALAQYYAAVSEIDTAVGRLIDTLEASGQLENTIIIYTSDHGLNCGQHGIWGKGNGTLPLNMVEESVRIPLIVSHPAQFSAGAEGEAFVDHLDTFQTILACAGVDLAEFDEGYPGRSYVPMLSDQQPADWRQHQICEYGPVRMISDGRFKLIQRGPGEQNQFFDLQTDPREMTDLFNDPTHQSKMGELTQHLEQYFETYASAEYDGRLGAALPQTNFTEAWR